MRFDTDLKALKNQVIVETYRSRGPGGQRKNKTETAIRLKHIPSGVTVVATEHRTQAHNRKLAFQRLKERLLKLSKQRKPRIPTSIPKRAIEKKKEEKTIRSVKKRLRKKVRYETKEWE
ncbi:MAG: peptide chain release factor-like protein [Thermodesulfobacteriota bacterium]